MLLIEYRQHDNSMFRAWTEEDSAYGSFKVLTRRELQTVIRACTLMGGLCRPAKDAHIDPIDMSTFEGTMELDDQTRYREQIGST